MRTNSKTILLHLGLASAFSFLIAAFYLTIFIFPDFGWYLLAVLYILIILAQILFYLLTTYTNAWLTILSFILNFLLWVTEQVNFESNFHDTFFYQNENFRCIIIILSGLLWGINKILLDRIFIFLKVNTRLTNRADDLLKLLTMK